MSGGRLVVLDRAGRDVKRYPLAEGLATLGSDPACDIRVMLPAVSAHHATVVVHANQTVVRSVSERETLVNGASVSVAALRHGDVIELGGRRLRWEYADPAARRPLAPEPALQRRVARSRAPRRGSEPAPRDVLVPALRASMPASSSSSTSGKQVAIVQPQRRDTSDQNDTARASVKQRAYAQVGKRSRPSKADTDSESADTDSERARRRSALADTTQATLWIESRKPSPRATRAPAHASPQAQAAPRAQAAPQARATLTPARAGPPARRAVSAKKSTPLRMAVLKRVQSAHKMRVMKIQAPLKLDSTKQAAIMLMTGYTPKAKPPSPKLAKRPSYVVKKPSPVRKTPKQGKRSSGRQSTATPKTSGSPTRTSSRSSKASDDRSVSILEITDSDIRRSSGKGSNSSRRSGGKSPLRSPLLPSPKKSALKDPSSRKSTRKTESIKFDLSNLENSTYNRSSDVFMVTETTRDRSISDESATNLTLHYSDTSSTRSPSPRKSINSRSSRMLEKSTGTLMTESPTSERSTLIESPRPRKSLRGSLILQKALGSSEADVSSYSRRTTKSVSDQSWSTTIASARRTRTLSPRASQNNLESYSIVDLVSIDSNESAQSGSIYNSAGSVSSAAYETPETVTGRRTRSTIDPTLLGSSTPYVAKKSSTPDTKTQRTTRASKSSISNSRLSSRSGRTRTSDSITTPENTEDATKNITFNSTRISRASKSRSRINDSDILLIEGEEEESSPRSSRRISKTGQPSPMVRKNISINVTPSNSPSVTEGMVTPENRHSPVEASTPVLSIQSLLDASQLSDRSQSSQKKGRKSLTMKRKTIGALRSEPKRGRGGVKSKSLNFAAGRSLRGRDMSLNLSGAGDDSQNDGEVVTPKSAVKLVQEAVKNKHSTAKKPLSKRSLIDNLNESDLVKQLFNSPVKRKLSQSMTEFSRKQLLDDDDVPARPTRATIAVVGRTPDNSPLENTGAFTPDVFVSPLSTPSNSLNLTGIRRLYQKNTPENDLRNVRGVKGLLRTPRTRKSIRNDLSNVAGVKNVFAKSPRNRLSDVRVKEVFAASPRNDLRRVSGVKTLFQSKKKARSPRNELDDVRGVRTLFQENSPKNDLRNISGVKRTLQRKSPRNDLSDVRGVKQMFRQGRHRDELSDMSGVEELFQDNIDTTFDQLMGRPPIRAYAKSKSFLSKVEKKKNTRKAKSLHDSISLITNNVEEWLENELRKRVHKDDAGGASTSTTRKSTPNKSKNSSKTNMTRELQKLTTDTIEGTAPIITSRTRNSSIINNIQSDVSTRKKSASELYSAHTLPIKKRSLVEISINKSNNDRSNKLPIKKRVVVHSTPVKGRVNMTMNASEIGRMSPIVSEDQNRGTEIEVMIRPPPPPKKSPNAKPARASKSKPNTPKQTEKSVEQVEPSPKKTRASKTVQSSPVPVRATRGRKTKNDNLEVPNTKKRRTSLVITKKAPGLSPKPVTPKVTRKGKAVKEVQAVQEVTNTSPKRTRATKAQISVESKATPKKNTRAKGKRSSMIVPKPSPKLKPRATRQIKEKTDTQQTEELETKRTRKTTVSETEPKEKNKRKKSENIKEQVEPTRKTRRANVETEPKGKGKAEVEKTVAPKRSRKTAAQDKTSEKEEAQNKRGRKATADKVEEPQTKTRGRQTEVQETVEPRRGRSTKAENTTTEAVGKGRGRKTKAEEVSVTTEPKGRGRKVKEAPQEEPVAKTRRGKATDDAAVEPATRGRKRKNTEQDDSNVTKAKTVQAEAKTRGAKGNARQTKSAAAVATAEVKANSRTRKGANSTQEKSATTEVAGGRKTRTTAQKEEETKSVRGKKATVVAENAPQEGGRKKRTNVDISDAKETKKEPAKKRKAVPAPSPSPSPAPRATRARLQTAVTQKGRGRRR